MDPVVYFDDAFLLIKYQVLVIKDFLIVTSMILFNCDKFVFLV